MEFIIHPDWQQIMNDHFFIQEVIGNKSTFDKEYKIVRKCDQSERWVHGMGELKFNENGQPVIMLGTIRDITEQKQGELLLKEKNEENRNSKQGIPANQ